MSRIFLFNENHPVCFLQGRNHLSVDKKSKSFEEREEDYKKARDRIFSQQEVVFHSVMFTRLPGTDCVKSIYGLST